MKEMKNPILMNNKWMFKVFVLFFVVITSCHAESGWQPVLYDESLVDNDLDTKCETNHQGEHELNKCRVYLDGDTIIIHFSAELPAYWGSMNVKIFDGKFNAQFDGVPFKPVDLKFETVKQKLLLNRSQYSLNDTLFGYCDFTFKEIEPATGHTFTFYFKGTIQEIVRDKDFNPFDPENFMTFDLPTAVHELGKPSR